MSRRLVIAVSNRKGGTGKTTTAVNVAAELGARGRRTLLIDLDTQGHAGIGLGVPSRRDAPTAHHAFRDPAFDLSDAVAETPVENVWLIPADQTYEESAGEADPTLLRRRLAGLAERFERIVFDTPPGLGNLLINALAAADGALVPMVPHHLGAEGVRQFARLFLRIGSTVNPDLLMVGLVPVMADRRMVLHRSVIEDMTRQFGVDRMLTPIRNDIHLAEAFAAGKPIRAYSPRSRGALDYKLLTDAVETFWRAPERP